MARKRGWWFERRRLRNQMIHEYVEDLTVLVDALNAAHAGAPQLAAAAAAM